MLGWWTLDWWWGQWCRDLCGRPCGKKVTRLYIIITHQVDEHIRYISHTPILQIFLITMGLSLLITNTIWNENLRAIIIICVLYHVSVLFCNLIMFPPIYQCPLIYHSFMPSFDFFYLFKVYNVIVFFTIAIQCPFKILAITDFLIILYLCGICLWTLNEIGAI